LSGHRSDDGPGRLPSLAALVRGADEIIRKLAPETAEHVGAGPNRIEGVGWATVELDRAAEEFRVGLDLPRSGAFRDGPPDGFLGAHTRFAFVRRRGIWIVLVEPSTEGRLAAFLARHGEGIAAVYVTRPKAERTLAGVGTTNVAPGHEAPIEPAPAASSTPSRVVDGPLGRQQGLAGDRSGPWLILLDSVPGAAED
jgi:hypothetical protein